MGDEKHEQYRAICQAEIDWYRRYGKYPERITRDSHGAQYVIGDQSWNQRNPHDDNIKFSPPYITIGIYARERRMKIERPNRETVAAIFKRRGEERARRRAREIAYANHLRGIHSFGYCEWCGPRYFYD